MKPKVLTTGITPYSNAVVDNLASFNNSTGSIIQDSGLSTKDVSRAVGLVTQTANHMEDEVIHITAAERAKWNQRESIVEHTLNEMAHVSLVDRENWNNKETPDGAQAKADIVQASLNEHIYDGSIHVTQYEKNRLERVYTKEEVDALFSAYEVGTAWKEPVPTYEDLAIKYPDPMDGWTVNILDSDLTYRFDGDEWICISANYIPLATQFVDGKMSKEDKYKLDTMAEGANYYIHPNDKYTRHVTDNQIQYWSAKAEDVLATYDRSGKMSSEDKVKLDNIEERANNYIHPGTHSARMIDQTDDLQFISELDRDYWNAKADANVATQFVDGLMTSEDKKKLDNIQANSNKYIHPDTHSAEMITETEDRQFVSVNMKNIWNAKFGRGDVVSGSAVFNGTSGTRIVHDLNDNNTLYSVMITVTSGANPNMIGTIWVNKMPNAIYVYSSGGNVADTFDYFIIKP